MSELCPHGRLTTAFCEPCAHDKIAGESGWLEIKGESPWSINISQEYSVEREPTGLDAPYYDLPKNIHSAQDLIEYLRLDFANGNILKSLIREHGAQTKTTDTLYEAQKRFYFAERHLRRVQKDQEVRRRLPNATETGETS